MCVKLHTVSKITLCGKLHTVCKFTHCESNYTLWVKWHTVCKMTHSLWNNTLCKKVLSGVLFALIVKKILSVNFFTLAPLLMLLTNMRYDVAPNNFFLVLCIWLKTLTVNNINLSALRYHSITKGNAHVRAQLRM